MPELPEVEAVCRKLRKQAIGAALVLAHIERRRITTPQDPVEVETLATGHTIERIDRRGKNILIRLSGGLAMRVHLVSVRYLVELDLPCPVRQRDRVIDEHNVRPVLQAVAASKFQSIWFKRTPLTKYRVDVIAGT
jgi:formamidopyrimidine-DNA glycosylase